MQRAPRTLSFHILRVCERLRISEAEFLNLPYSGQMRLLAYDRLRQEDQAYSLSQE